MADTDLLSMTISELAPKVQAKEISPVAVSYTHLTLPTHREV